MLPCVSVGADQFSGETAVAIYDRVIKDGMIIDGTRAPRYRADIGIKDGRIARIGHIDAAPKHVGADDHRDFARLEVAER